MRLLSILVILGIIGYGGYWINNNRPELKHKALDLINTDSFHVLEARFTAKQIMEKARGSFNKDSVHYTEPSLKFYPYLLMDVKFVNANNKTEEGALLWDLKDGEMVIDVSTWNKSHGFADCIKTRADHYELSILKIIEKNKGKVNQHLLMNALGLEPNLFHVCIDHAKKKHLIIQQGQDYRIHLADSCFDVKPFTRVSSPLITTNCQSKHSERISCHYSPNEVIRIATANFSDEHFAIRHAQSIWLPIYVIIVQKADGSHHTTYWNSINGKPFRSHLIE